MALVNDAKKEINAKIVYLGPKGAGKATALRFIYSKLKPECRSDLKCMALGEHQMLFFDFSYPLPRRSNGYSLRFHIYTLNTGGESPPPWKMLLKGTDGVVLFADSAEGRMYGNLECCTLLLDSLGHYGLKLDGINLSLQCNKRDLKKAAPLVGMKNELLPEIDIEPLPVTAITGDGLLEGLDRTVKGIMKQLGEDVEETVGDDNANATAVLAEEGAGTTIGSSFQHCPTATTGFEVAVTGAAVTIDSNTVVIPLKLKGGECGKSVDIKITVSVSL